MSIKIMSAIWDNGPEKQAERFVLLALADHANDQGECWPAVSSLAKKTCMSVRGVQTVLRRLQVDGWLSIEVGGGRKNCNIYRIKTPQLTTQTPQQLHPLSDEETPQLTTETPQLTTQTPQLTTLNPAGAAPEPSRTIIEPSREPSREPPLDPPERKRRAVQLPDDWTPNDRNIEDAFQRKFSGQEIDHEADQFRNHHIAKGSRFVDWDAAWRTWLGNARKFSDRRMAVPSHARGGRSGGSMAAIAARNRGHFPI